MLRISVRNAKQATGEQNVNMLAQRAVINVEKMTGNVLLVIN